MHLFICLLFIPVQPETIGRYMRLCLLYHLSLCLSGSSSAQIEHSLSHTHTKYNSYSSFLLCSLSHTGSLPFLCSLFYPSLFPSLLLLSPPSPFVCIHCEKDRKGQEAGGWARRCHETAAWLHASAQTSIVIDNRCHGAKDSG